MNKMRISVVSIAITVQSGYNNNVHRNCPLIYVFKHLTIKGAKRGMKVPFRDVTLLVLGIMITHCEAGGDPRALFSVTLRGQSFFLRKFLFANCRNSMILFRNEQVTQSESSHSSHNSATYLRGCGCLRGEV